MDSIYIYIINTYINPNKYYNIDIYGSNSSSIALAISAKQYNAVLKLSISSVSYNGLFNSYINYDEYFDNFFLNAYAIPDITYK